MPLIYPSDKSFKEQIGNAALFMDLENHNTLVDNIKKLYDDKIQTAQFYFNRILPRAEAHFNSVKTGSDYIMNFDFN